MLLACLALQLGAVATASDGACDAASGACAARGPLVYGNGTRFWQRDDVLDRPWYSSREYLLEWFERDATTLKPEDGLHKLSGWGYLNTTQYQEIVRAAAARLDPPLRDGDSVFELGCGVGGVLSVLAQQYPG